LRSPGGELVEVDMFAEQGREIGEFAALSGHRQLTHGLHQR
jgi:hypothetical protein